MAEEPKPEAKTPAADPPPVKAAEPEAPKTEEPKPEQPTNPAPAEGKTEEKPETPPAETPKTDTPPAEEKPAEEPKKKGFHLFGRKKGDKAEPKIVKKEPEVPTELNPTELAQVIDKQILDTKAGDYWIIRIKKQTLLVLMGLLLMSLWLIPLGKFALARYGMPSFSFNLQELTKKLPIGQKSEATPTPTTPIEEKSEGPKVRIRYETGSQVEAGYIADKIKSTGLTTIEMVEDTENSYEALALVVKPGQEELKASLAQALQEYTFASSSAELTEDSNFDVLIMFGKP